MPNLTLVTPTPIMQEPDLKKVIAYQDEFCKAYEVRHTTATQELYVHLLEEEHEEWVEEYYSTEGREFDELKELADMLYVTAGLYYHLGYTVVPAARYKLPKDDTWDMAISKLTEQVSLGKKDKRLLLNLMYSIYAYADAMEYDIDEAYRRVHISNMSKLGDNGKPVCRDDGKVMKGPNYKPPYLEDLTNGK